MWDIRLCVKFRPATLVCGKSLSARMGRNLSAPTPQKHLISDSSPAGSSRGLGGPGGKPAQALGTLLFDPRRADFSLQLSRPIFLISEFALLLDRRNKQRVCRSRRNCFEIRCKPFWSSDLRSNNGYRDGTPGSAFCHIFTHPRHASRASAFSRTTTAAIPIGLAAEDYVRQTCA